MPKNLQIELTAESEKGCNRTPNNSANALVSTRSYALVGSPVRPAIHAKLSLWRRWGLWFGLAVAAGLGSWMFYAQPWQAHMVPVVVEIVAPGPVTRVLAVNGRIAASRSVAVRSTVAGTLVPPLADEGDKVARDDVLARLDDTSQQAAVRQAVAALDQGLVAQTQARETLARAEALRTSVPRVTLDDARRAVERAEQEVGRLRAWSSRRSSS